MIIKDIIINVNINRSGTLANNEAVFNTSRARSPPTNIREKVIDIKRKPRINDSLLMVPLLPSSEAAAKI